MSYDLTLHKKEGFKLNVQMLKDEFFSIEELACQEVIFIDEVDSLDLTDFFINEIKHCRDLRKEYYRYLAERGIKVNAILKLMKKVDRDLAMDFIKNTNHFGEKAVEVLTVYAHEVDLEKIEVLISHLKHLAQKYNLLLFDNQKGEYIN